MVYLFIGAYVILGFLVFIMFKVLKRSVDKIGDQSKTYYIDKLQEYDDIINDKETKINTLDEEIKNKKVEAESIKANIKNEQSDFDISIIDLLNRTKYQDEDIFKIEKIIDESFNYDNKKIVESFIEKTPGTKNYEFCKKFKRKFSSKKMYDLKIMSDKELDSYLDKNLSDKEKELLEVYKKSHKSFKVDEFARYLDELVNLNNPSITIYVGNKNENYDYLNKYIETKYDKNIYRGIKIKYQSRMYDFSLSGKDL